MEKPTPVDFDHYSDDYREAVEGAISFARTDLDFFVRTKAEVLLELASAEVGPPAELGFLDVGCGPGETDGFLQGRVGGLAGVDVAPRMIAEARRRHPWAEYRDYEAGERLPWEASSFDVCFAVCVFHHVKRGQRLGLLREMARVTRSGGLIALFEHNPLNPLTRRAVRDCEFDRDAELITRRSASRLMREAGLRPAGRYVVFFTRESGLLRRVERRLGWLPLGAQYALFAQRP